MNVEGKLELAKAIIAAQDARNFKYIAWVDAVSTVTDDDDIRDLVAIMTNSSWADTFYTWATSYIASYNRYIEARRLHQGKD